MIVGHKEGDRERPDTNLERQAKAPPAENTHLEGLTFFSFVLSMLTSSNRSRLGVCLCLQLVS